MLLTRDRRAWRHSWCIVSLAWQGMQGRLQKKPVHLWSGKGFTLDPTCWCVMTLACCNPCFTDNRVFASAHRSGHLCTPSSLHVPGILHREVVALFHSHMFVLDPMFLAELGARVARIVQTSGFWQSYLNVRKSILYKNNHCSDSN